MREEIRRNGYGYNVSTAAANWITWDGCYVNGYREPRYPVPAHAYIIITDSHSVEMVTGIKKSFDRECISFDCDCVLFVADYEEHHAPGPDRRK